MEPQNCTPLVLAFFALGSAFSFAVDNENANNTSDGAEILSAPVAVNDYTASNGDSDWFLIRKGKCDVASISFLSDSSPNNIYTLEIHRISPSGPLLYTTTDTVGGNLLDIIFPEEVTSFYVVVTGKDLMGSWLYDLSVQTQSKNAAGLAEISRQKTLLKKA